jgi:2-polyprenyl-3-methyl-5-hydroxy-6-metoxy-1,4-benzoquinol methylase
MHLLTDKARAAEHAKYNRAYALNPNYRMKKERLADAVNDLRALPCRHSYLDVSCGRGEMLLEAKKLGFSLVTGTEIVADLLRPNVFYSEVHDIRLVTNFAEVVTMFDVIEHLIPGDDELACRELARVASKHVLLTANNKPSFNKAGDDLHINKRPYAEWDRLFRAWFAPAKVTWIRGKRSYVSEAWRVDL